MREICINNLFKGILLLIINALLFNGCRKNERKNENMGLNVILILSDDQGYAHTGVTKDLYLPEELPEEKIKALPGEMLEKLIEAANLCTPVIDQLASSGMRFTNMLAAPTCAPSRLALMSGLYPQRMGIYTNLDINENGAPPETHFLVKNLQNKGYKTAIIGKWHLGSGKGQHPNEKGFDYYFGFDGAQTAKYHSKDLFKQKEHVEAEGFLCDQLTSEALEFIEDQAEKDNPFFLFLSYNEPHGPRPTPPGQYLKPFNTGDRLFDEFYAYIYAMDCGIGKILDKIAEHNLDKNTLVIFTSDNGGVYHMPLPLNGSLKGGKGMIWDGARKVPMVVNLPGIVTKGETYYHYLSIMDIMPTILDATGNPVSGEKNLDGKSFYNVLKGDHSRIHEKGICWASNTNLLGAEWEAYEKEWREKNAEKPITERQWQFWVHPAGWAIHKGEWKLMKAGPEEIELYNILRDPGESQNLAKKHPEKVHILREEYNRWINEMPEPLSWDVSKWKDFFPYCQ